MNGIEIRLSQFRLFLPYSVLIPSLKMGSDISNQRLFRSRRSNYENQTGYGKVVVQIEELLKLRQ